MNLLLQFMKKMILILILYTPVYPLKEPVILMSGSLLSKAGRKLVIQSCIISLGLSILRMILLNHWVGSYILGMLDI